MISGAFSESGLEKLLAETVCTAVLVRKNQIHEQFPGFSVFDNILGTLVPGMGPEPETGQVLERSLFLALMARKPG